MEFIGIFFLLTVQNICLLGEFFKKLYCHTTLYSSRDSFFKVIIGYIYCNFSHLPTDVTLPPIARMFVISQGA